MMFGSLVYELMLMDALARAAIGDGPANPCANAQDVAENERTAYDARQDRDRAWIERELGDVPCRPAAEQWSPEQLAGWAKAVSAPYEPNSIVPVESLGRDE